MDSFKDSNPHQEMFADVVRALTKQVSRKRPSFWTWLEDNEPFLALEILNAQGEIAMMYKNREHVDIKEFGDYISKHYWNNFKEGMKRYDKRKTEND